MVAAVLVAATPCSQAAPVEIYGIKSTSLSHSGPEQYEPPALLYRYLDDGTGLTPIGNVRLADETQLRADGLAYSPNLGLWFFEPTPQGPGAQSVLRPLDPATAVAGTGTVLPGRNVFGAAFDALDRLWAIDEEADELIRVIPATGQVMESVGLTLDSSPFDLVFGSGDLAFDSMGQAWIVYHDKFYQVDLSTGVMTEMFDENGISLYMVGAAFSHLDPSHLHIFDVAISWNNDDLLRYDVDDAFTRHEVVLKIFDNFNAGRGDLAIAAQVIPPTLAITRSGPDLILSWPQAAPGWSLYESPTLGVAPSPWTQVTPPYATSGTDYTHTIPGATGTSFFRLQKP